MPDLLDGLALLGNILVIFNHVNLAMSSQLVEKLYRLKWGIPDGLGGLIISPTRELAMQIFDELRKVGQKHDLSAGLLIGGKNVKDERDRVNGGELCFPSAIAFPLVEDS
jgi:hypothetical protein